MLLTFTNGEPFSSGAKPYLYKPIREHDDPPTPRLILEVQVEGHKEVAAIDTGGAYLICSPALAEKLGFDYDEKYKVEINILGRKLRGNLRRLDVILSANEGNSVRIDATVFIPDLTQGIFDSDFLPVPLIGLLGCLERVRFAVDPSDETFHFGDCPSHPEGQEIA